MKNFRFNAICNITQELQELQKYNRACRFTGKSAVVQYHELLSKLQVLTGDRYSTSLQQLLLPILKLMERQQNVPFGSDSR